jgi:host factor-I protein
MMPMMSRAGIAGAPRSGGGKGPRSPLGEPRQSLRKQNPKPRQVPPADTAAETFYYLKQMNAKTPMVIVMSDGEEIRGWIEWYDSACLKVNREGAPNIVLRKAFIKYMYKEEE